MIIPFVLIFLYSSLIDISMIKAFERFYNKIDEIFHEEPTSLLHGDLWSGNWAADDKGRPVIFDPASYYGDREADLAMMELFGHPGRQFFDAYNEHYPMDEGYKLRKHLYNVYHILNHTNMFGHSYASQAESMIEALLAEVS